MLDAYWTSTETSKSLEKLSKTLASKWF
jgi:hypothetical protein